MTVAGGLFEKPDCLVRVEGNHQLILDTEASAWVVVRGAVYVFASRLSKEGDAGRRHYISEFGEGDMLFGARPCIHNGETVAFLCTGMMDTQLMKVDMEEIMEAWKDKDRANHICTSVKKWVSALAESTMDLLSDLEWLQHVELENSSWMEELTAFNQKAVKKAALYIETVYRDEERRMELKRSKDSSFVEDSLKTLIEVSKQGRKKHRKLKDGMEYSENPLLAACQAVGNAMGINITLPPEAVLEKSNNILLDVVRASHIRYRQIILSGEWWKADNGPFLAFLQEGDAPVALIPSSSKSYRMFNPKDGSEIAVDEETARDINPKAYMFYRTLPNKELGIKDLIRFCSGSSIKKDLALVVFIGILGGLINMCIPIANGILFNSVIPEGERGQLLQLALILGSFGISGVLFQLTRTFAMLKVESKMDTSLQAAIWDRVLSLPVPFFRQFTAGELAMRTMGINQIRRALSGTVISTVLSAIFSIFNFGLLFRYSTKMAWYALALIVISVAITLLLSFLQLKYKREVTKVSNKIAGLVLQIIGGIAKFRVAGAEKRAFFQWAKAYGKQRETEYKNKSIENTLITVNAVFPVVTSILLFYAAFSTANLGVGSFIAFNSAFTGFMGAMLALSNILPMVNHIIPVYESTKPILKTLPEYDDVKEDPGELDGSIELSHVTFRYKPDMPAVIHDLSLKINKGEYLAIVGASGCGKSTLLRLILGFEKPEAGKIYYEQHDIEKVDIRSVRRQLGVVMQNGQLMPGDILSNIIGTNPQLKMEDAVEAAKMAGLYEDIKAMPMGMFTVVSEGGSTLSGGQRQRILIARVLAGKPKIILFDEATSALDNKTQATVSRSMDSLKATRVVIAHRLSTIINCDRIIVMDKGRIVEEGTYEDLMKRGERFYELAKRQLA